MKQINNMVLHAHIKDNGDLWKSEFPDLASIVDEILKSPKCGICLQKMMKGLVETDDFAQRIKEGIYNDSTISGFINIQNVSKVKEVKEFTPEQWKDFYLNFKGQIQNGYQYYDPTINKIVFSYTGSENNPIKHDI